MSKHKVNTSIVSKAGYTVIKQGSRFVALEGKAGDVYRRIVAQGDDCAKLVRQLAQTLLNRRGIGYES